MYRPYKDAFRGKMGHVAQDAEDVHVHRCSALITGGRAPLHKISVIDEAQQAPDAFGIDTRWLGISQRRRHGRK